MKTIDWQKILQKQRDKYGKTVFTLTELSNISSHYVLVAILKKRLNLDQSLYTILQFLSVSIFEKTPISEAFTQEFDKIQKSDYDNQLLLFNL